MHWQNPRYTGNYNRSYWMMINMVLLVNFVILSMLILTAFAVERQKNLFASTMLMGIFSLLCASLFVCMDAVDVAFTEASVGAGIATFLFLSTLAFTDYEEKHSTVNRLPALLIVTATGALLIYGINDIPHFGATDAPVHQHLSPRYLLASGDEIGIPNAVTSVLASYRGYDTFGEVTVVFAALVGVLMLLGRS